MTILTNNGNNDAFSTSKQIKNSFIEQLKQQVIIPDSKRTKTNVETDIRPGDGLGLNSKITG
ncbi:MAG: hypothetical protein IKV94_03340 [Clostridia bacterium]|nr:hypothetical protein [Clostridia bacterium]